MQTAASDQRMRLLACVSQPVQAPGAEAPPPRFDVASSIQSLASAPRADGVEVKILVNPALSELTTALQEYEPTVLYISGLTKVPADSKTGSVDPFTFQGGETIDLTLLKDTLSGKMIDTLFLDCPCSFSKARELQTKGVVPHVIAWNSQGEVQVPGTIAAQFSHSFFTFTLTYAASVHEAFAISGQIVQAYFTTKSADGMVPPELPHLLSPKAPMLPDNTSIPRSSDIPGLDNPQGMAGLAGWSDLRLLAPRAELRLLLCGSPSLIDSTRLSFLGEALRSLLVLEMRCVKLLNSTPSTKVPANLLAGCTAIRCEVQTASGRLASVVLGGLPEVLKETRIVEYALRMTLVSDSLSLQFRLPPPGVDIPAPRRSSAIAGGAQVVDTVCLSSVWAVQVLRSLSQDEQHKGMLTIGVAAVGGSASIGVTALEAQRLSILSTGERPSAKDAEAGKDAEAHPNDGGEEEPSKRAKMENGSSE